MSRVADALRLARLDAPGTGALTNEDRAWGLDDARHDFRRERNDPGAPAAAAVVDDEEARMRAPDSMREPEVLQPISPLTTLSSDIRQQIAGIVERVFLPRSGEAPRVVAFAGLDADARSGWIAAAVADMLAQRTAARIAIADLNFTDPEVDRYYRLEASPGLAEAFRTDAPLVTMTQQIRPNLWAMPAGARQGPVELTAASRARISRLASAFDHVIVSLEPLAASCGGGLPTMSDGVVLVIAADATRREAGRQIAERLQSSGAVILGAVLTNRRYAIPEAIYKRL